MRVASGDARSATRACTAARTAARRPSASTPPRASRPARSAASRAGSTDRPPSPAGRGRSCDTRPATCQRLPRNTRRTPHGATVDGSWITRSRRPNLVDRTPCGRRPSRAIIRSARRGRDERTAVPPQGGRAPRKGSRILRQEGRPFRKGGVAVRRLHRCRKVPNPLARVGGAPQGAPQLPARVASPPQGGRGDRVGGPFGRFADRRGVRGRAQRPGVAAAGPAEAPQAPDGRSPVGGRRRPAPCSKSRSSTLRSTLRVLPGPDPSSGPAW